MTDKKQRTIELLDTFCGAGGSSTGAVLAIEELGHRPALTCVNHNKMAIATHTINHPWARHFCTGIDDLNLNSMYGDTLLDVLWSSPSCVSHSTAKGGTPVNEQDRATGWCVVRIAETLRPPVILIENVPAFLKWAPCERRWSKKNARWELHPDKKREGETFQAWINALKSLGYKVDWKILCCADFGDPTTRERLFVQCVAGKRKIVWPNATHADPKKLAGNDLFANSETRIPWVPARTIIDWTLAGSSIFKRPKTLVEKTLRRIFLGLDRIGLKNFTEPGTAEEFLVHQMGQSTAERLDAPLSAVVGAPKHYLGEPFLAKLRGSNTTALLGKPTPTITAGGTHLGLVEIELSALLPQQSEGILRDVKDPVPTISTAGAISLIQAKTTKLENEYLVQVAHGNSKTENCGDTRRIKPLDQTLGAVTGSNEFGIVEPRLSQVEHPNQNENQNQEGPTADASLKALVGKVLEKINPTNFSYHGQWHENGCPIIEIQGELYILEILFRMLQPHELAAAQGFPKGYQFKGTKTEIIKQIGNAVPCRTARALVKAALTQNPEVGQPEYDWTLRDESLTFAIMESHGKPAKVA